MVGAPVLSTGIHSPSIIHLSSPKISLEIPHIQNSVAELFQIDLKMYLEYCIIISSKTLLMLCINKVTTFYIIKNVLHSAQ